jgi:hypothetical protein
MDLRRLRWASYWLQITPPDWRGLAEKPILKKPKERFVGIVSIDVPMCVGNANMVHAPHLRLR